MLVAGYSRANPVNIVVACYVGCYLFLFRIEEIHREIVWVVDFDNFVLDLWWLTCHLYHIIVIRNDVSIFSENV